MTPASPRVVIAGTASGVGKTTVVAAICAALRARGLAVQPFKSGPDYIDPTYHTQAAGRPCRSLDSFLLDPDTLRSLFARAARPADLTIVEGVMGLYDGRDGVSESGSTAEVAKLIGAPVVIVLDVAAQSRTAAAVAVGCVEYDRGLRVAGFIVNRVGSDGHARWVTDAIESATHLPVLGAIPRDESLVLPERHLGLVPASERALSDGDLGRLAALGERHIALDRVVAIARTAPPLAADPPRAVARGPRARIAVARDRAFGFYYEDSLELLELAGAELVPFSPLADGALPEAAGGLYIGGGFPEVFARELSENVPMRDAVRDAVARGVATVAECGGLMYLGRELVDAEGRAHAMVGALPIVTAMRRDRLTLGYRSLTTLRRNPLLDAGESVRAHEFHYSELIDPGAAEPAAFAVAERNGRHHGYAGPRLLASYMHIHLGSRPELAARFVQASRPAATPG